MKSFTLFQAKTAGVLAIFCLTATQVFAQQYYVAPSGGLSIGQEKKTIQAAITTAPAGATINVASGTYAGGINVSKTLTIRGANAGVSGSSTRSTETIIDGGATADGIIAGANDVVIDGFTIQNGGGNVYGGVGVGFGTVTGVKVLNNIITNNVIGVAQCPANTLIKGNKFDGNNKPGAAGGAGIYTDVATNGLVIESNEFINNTQNNPVIFAATAANMHQNLTFTKNYIHDNPVVASSVYCVAIAGGVFTQNVIIKPGTAAIRLGGACTNITILNNTLDNNDYGVRIIDDGYGFGSNSNVTIQQNSIASFAQKAIDNNEAFSVNATCNWYGTPTPANTVVGGNVTFLPALSAGTDAAPATIGFQPQAACGSTPVVDTFTASGDLSAGACTVQLIARGQGIRYVVNSPNGYIYSNVFRANGQNTVTFPAVKAPGAYTLTIYGDGGASTTNTVTVNGTGCQ